jgi:hypothetical protein
MSAAEQLLERIDRAFAAVPRPPNSALLHPDCRDDGDLFDLYEVEDWRAIPDEHMPAQYSALSFLSAEGMRYFLPAYLRHAARFPRTEQYVVEATVRALAGADEFSRSKLVLLDAEQRAAVGEVLAHVDAEAGPPERAGFGDELARARERWPA